MDVVSTSAISSFLDIAKETGIEIVQEGKATLWTGPAGGNTKPQGPLAGKTIGVIVASEFSDFQAYYMVSYVGEYGGKCEFLLVDWVTWKFTRPNIPNKGVKGMWGMSVDPVPVLGGDKSGHYKNLGDVNPKDYDALVILGGHSADVMVTEDKVIDFIKAAYDNEAIMGAIGAGSMPLIRAGIMHGKKCTGNNLVSYMLKKIAKFQALPVVTDGKIITARDTVDTPVFFRALCQTFNSNFEDKRQNILTGKKVMILTSEDFEDIELVVPTMEFLYRGAEVIITTYPAPMKSRPPLLGLDVIMGNFGVSIPFQEIPDSYYTIKKLADVKMSDFDLVMIPGAFNPWNVVASGTSEWLKDAYAAGKLIGAICHGPIPVAAADLAEGKKMTGWLASKDSVEIMSGEFHPEWAACIDGQIVTGRTPPEIPEFLDAMTEALLR